MWISSFLNAICWRDCPFPIEWSSHPRQRSFDHICEGLFLGSLFLFIYLWLCWVLAPARGLSPVAASGDHSSSQCTGLSLSRPLLLRSTGSRRAGSVIVAHGPSHSAARGILPDQGSNPCPPHWQADSQPLRHQGSPRFFILFHWSKYLSLCQYHTVLITVAL